MHWRIDIVKYWARVGVVLLLALGAVAVVMHWRHLFPSGTLGEIYARYSEAEDVKAVLTQDFRLNDTVTVDVIILEAATDSAWTALKEDFRRPTPPPEVLALLGQDALPITFSRASRDDYSRVEDGRDYDFLLMVQQDPQRRLTIFDITDEKQSAIIIHIKVLESMRK